MRKLVLGLCACVLCVNFMFAKTADELYRKCVGCHGKYAKHAPFEKESGILQGRNKEELKLIMLAIRDGHYKDDRIGVIMKKSIKDFSDKDVESLAEYISEL